MHPGPQGTIYVVAPPKNKNTTHISEIAKTYILRKTEDDLERKNNKIGKIFRIQFLKP